VGTYRKCRTSSKLSELEAAVDQLPHREQELLLETSRPETMQEWHNRIGDMLAYVNDKLHPHGSDEIVKDDFGELRQMLVRAAALRIVQKLATASELASTGWF
jgi:hypothetical protein